MVILRLKKNIESHYPKRPIDIHNVDIDKATDINNVYLNKIMISNKVSFGKKGFKYFIVYKDDKKVKPLNHYE